MKRLRWLTWMAVCLLVLTLGAGPVSAQGGDAVLGGTYTLRSGETRNSDLLVMGGSATLEPESVVNGNVAVMGGSTTIEGHVRGDVVAFGGSVELTQSAEIDGDLVVFGTVRQHADAKVHGNVVRGLEASGSLQLLPDMLGNLPLPGASMSARGDWSGPERAMDALRGFGTLLMVLFVAFLAATLLPDHMRRITEAATTAWLPSLLTGGITLLLLVVIVPLLVIICIGIPVAVVLGVAFAVSALLGWVAFGQIVGRRVLAALKVSVTPVAETLAGTALITILAWIPCLGGLFSLVIVCWGVGAVVLTRFGVMAYHPHSGGGTPWQPPTGGPAAPPPSAPPEASTQRETSRLDDPDRGEEIDVPPAPDL